MGVSDNKDELTIYSLQTDIFHVFNFAKNEFPTELPIAIHGLSMGSIIAAYVASNKKVDALIINGAISSVPKLMNDFLPVWSKFFIQLTYQPN